MSILKVYYLAKIFVIFRSKKSNPTTPNESPVEN